MTDITVFMTLIGVLLLLFVLICLLVGIASRTLSWYFSRVLRNKYGFKLKIRRFGFLSLREVYLQFPDGTTIEAESIWFSSNLFSSKYRSLLIICLGDVRFQANFDKLLDNNQVGQDDNKKQKQKQKRLSGKVISIIKRISLHIYNASIMQLGAPSQDCLLHTTVQELALHVVVEETQYCSKLSLTSAALKIFKHPQETTPGDSCLAHFCVSVESSISLSIDNPSVVHNATVSVQQPEIMLYEGLPVEKLFEVLSTFRRSRKEAKKAAVKEKPLKDVPDIAQVESTDFAKFKTLPLKQLLRKLPENLDVKLESFTIKILRENWQRGLSLDIRSINAELKTDVDDLFLNCVVSLSDLSVTSDHIKVLNLNNVQVKNKVRHQQIDLNVHLSSFHALYQQEELYHWLKFLPSSKNNPEIEVPKDKPLFRLLRKLSLMDFSTRVTAELEDVSASFKLSDCPSFSTGLVHTRFSADLTPALEMVPHDALATDISSELMLEMVWCTLDPASPVKLQQLKKYHFWNVPLSIGMMFLKTRCTPSHLRIQCMLGSIHMEMNSQVNSLLQFILRHQQKNELVKKQSVPSRKPSRKIVLHLNLSDTNVFAISSLNMGLMLRLDTLNFDMVSEKMCFNLDGFVISSVSPEGHVFTCIPAAEVKTKALFIKSIRLNYKTDCKEINLQLLEEVYASWSTTLHMTALTCFQDMDSLKSSFYGKPSDTYSNPKVTYETSQPIVFHVSVQGRNIFEIILSKAHQIQFITSDLNIKVKHKQLSVQTDYVTVRFDEHPIFTFQQLLYFTSPAGEKSAVNRHTFKDLELPQNKSWTLTFDEIRVIFPCNYNFAEACSEQTVSVVKWLKLVHKKKKKTFTLESPLPADFAIKIKVLTVEIGDDPFEVKLRDNYELLEDEYHESLKRKKVLDEKIDSFRRTHLMLPEAKIEELNASLAKKNADIYIQRSRQLYSGGEMRTHLIVWHVEQLDINAVADYSYHGTERVVNKINQFDAESPYPEEGLEFSTLWCRNVSGSMQSLTCQFRDFQHSFVECREFHWWGCLVGAEQEASPRAKRTSVVEVAQPWGNMTVERSMPSLKFYYDLTWDIGSLTMTYGACWEPIMAQVNIAMECINKPSADLSPPLTWWDKWRLLFHGRLTVSAQQLSYNQHVSLDPYNATELFEVRWTETLIEWTNGRVVMKGNLDMYVHTASRYNSSRILHIPKLKVCAKMDWLCLGNPLDHHSVMPCAPDKIPEYSSNQEHDSYRAFRSQNLNLSLSLETKSVALETADNIPTLLLYSSTLKWMENLKVILGGLPKLTKRGVLFKNTKPRKAQLSRHYRSIRLAISFHKFQICYWTSLAKQHGFELLGGRLALSSEYTLSLTPVDDGLTHRPRANWSIAYMNCELGDSEIWLYNYAAPSPSESGDILEPEAQRRYFLSVARVSYGRETKIRNLLTDEEETDTPTHRLVVHGLRGAWTKHNRDVVFGLFDSYVSAKLLKRNLSTDALKSFKVEAQQSPQKPRSYGASPSQSSNSNSSAASSNRLQSGHAVSMLEKLLSDTEANSMVYTEDIEGSNTEPQQLHGVTACQTDDVLQKNWLIELINSQVMLRGCETSGYVIVSAAKAQILQRVHRPVWKERTLVSKTTWVGSLDCMQYYATVDAGEPGPSVSNIMWLTLDNIEERVSMVISDLPDLVGSGHSVGGVVSSTVGGAPDPNTAPLQLQRIISRCGCQFFYASYGENIDPDSLEEVPPLFEDTELWEQDVAVDSFTLTHHDLEICTNPLQYAMILDLVNNLLLYVEPRRKEANERLQRMRFQLQLSSVEDQRGPILQLQNQVRSLISRQRQLERETYLTQRSLEENPESEELSSETAQLETDINLCKEQLNAASEELAMIINCYKETQVSALKSRQQATDQDQHVSVVRRSEVCFKHARWRLTDVDGQLGIADLVLSNFLYSRVTKSNDSVEHLLELGYVKVTNLLPNQTYKDVLQPTELQPNIPLDRQRALRIFCRVRAPVGGISVKEHLEVNVIPIAIGLTHAFTSRMLKFFFPDRDTEKADEHAEEESKVSHVKKRSTLTLPRSVNPASSRDDIEKMKERAEKNQTFLYVKIPEVPLRLSYKGEKEKNIEDLNDCALVLPTLEIHNRTCTWLDLLMIIKADTKKVFLSQAIKQKLQIKSNQGSTEDSNQPQEEDKARLLLGSKLVGAPEKSTRRGFLKRVQQ